MSYLHIFRYHLLLNPFYKQTHWNTFNFVYFYIYLCKANGFLSKVCACVGYSWLPLLSPPPLQQLHRHRPGSSSGSSSWRDRDGRRRRATSGRSRCASGSPGARRTTGCWPPACGHCEIKRKKNTIFGLVKLCFMITIGMVAAMYVGFNKKRSVQLTLGGHFAFSIGVNGVTCAIYRRWESVQALAPVRLPSGLTEQNRVYIWESLATMLSPVQAIFTECDADGSGREHDGWTWQVPAWTPASADDAPRSPQSSDPARNRASCGTRPGHRYGPDGAAGHYLWVKWVHNQWKFQNAIASSSEEFSSVCIC